MSNPLDLFLSLIFVITLGQLSGHLLWQILKVVGQLLLAAFCVTIAIHLLHYLIDFSILSQHVNNTIKEWLAILQSIFNESSILGYQREFLSSYLTQDSTKTALHQSSTLYYNWFNHTINRFFHYSFLYFEEEEEEVIGSSESPVKDHAV